MTDYIALIHKEKGSDFGVSFPDFPCCVTAGSTLSAAKDMAKEALQFHIDGMVEDKLDIPEASIIEDVMKDKENREAVAYLVSVETMHD